jgi:hypothetical protein
VGPFKTALGGYKQILVAVDKFTKWIEVHAVATVTSKEATKFIEDITYWFGVPNRIVTDLGKAFTGSYLWDFCQDSLIDVYYSSVAHPRCNGQVERENGMVLQAVIDRIFDGASQYAIRWHVELPHVIWGLRTQVSLVTEYSPFFLVYGSEVVLPTDVAFGAPHIQHYKEGTTEETRKVDHDSIEEHHVAALMWHTGTSSSCDAIMTATCGSGPSTWETWSYIVSKAPRECTISLPLGKVPVS